MKHRKILCIAAAVVLIAGLLAGCGEDNSPDKGTGTETFTGRIVAVDGSAVTVALVEEMDVDLEGIPENMEPPEGFDGQLPEDFDGQPPEDGRGPAGEDSLRVLPSDGDFPEGELGERPEPPDGQLGERPEGGQGRPGGPMPYQDTGEEKTVTITEDTKILSASGEAVTVDDLFEGAVVSVTVKGESSDVIQIVGMQPAEM